MLQLKNSLLKILGLIVLSTILQSNALAQDEAYTTKLYKYLELSGSKANAIASINQMIDGLKARSNMLPDEFYAQLSQRFDASYDDLVEMLVPVYFKYFSTEDLDALISFSESEIGLKMTSVLPLLLQESMVIGQSWGAQVGEEIMLEIMEQEVEGE